jgi:hypothetical protein
MFTPTRPPSSLPQSGYVSEDELRGYVRESELTGLGQEDYPDEGGDYYDDLGVGGLGAGTPDYLTMWG